MTVFKGSGVAIITPFNENEINFPKFKELIEWQIAEGTDAIIVCGTTGESTTMSESEKKNAIKFVVETVNKRIPVIAGTGSNNTAASIEMSKFSESVVVDGLLFITPYYNKTNKKGLFKHFEAINNAVNIPIILYNVPSRTNVNITPEALLELSSLSNITGIKEASGNISQIAKIKALCGNKLDIYSGNDDQVTSILALGGVGVISVLANLTPKAVHEMVMSYLTGDTKKSLTLQLEYLKLINDLFIETNPIPVKTALNLMGKEVGKLRLPLYEMDEKNKSILCSTLKNYGLM
ncbi:MAG: 4-hydroxy-tetrahydrodipicolinate synthase [Clostridium sp.]|nr:4-hydroxy-tetrahydrodipicolinate synthase [Clostridium sp.]